DIYRRRDYNTDLCKTGRLRCHERVSDRDPRSDLRAVAHDRIHRNKPPQLQDHGSQTRRARLRSALAVRPHVPRLAKSRIANGTTSFVLRLSTFATLEVVSVVFFHP